MMISRFGTQPPLAPVVRFQSNRSYDELSPSAPDPAKTGTDAENQATEEHAARKKEKSDLEKQIALAQKRRGGFRRMAGGLLLGSLGLTGILGVMTASSDADPALTDKGNTLRTKAADVNPVDRILAEQLANNMLTEYSGDTVNDALHLRTINNLLDIQEQRERADLQLWLDELGVPKPKSFLEAIIKNWRGELGVPNSSGISDQRLSEIAKRLQDDNSLENQQAVFNEMMNRDLASRFAGETELQKAKDAGNAIFEQVKANEDELMSKASGLILASGVMSLAMLAALAGQMSFGEGIRLDSLRRQASLLE